MGGPACACVVGAVIGVTGVDKTFALHQGGARLGVGNRAVDVGAFVPVHRAAP